MNRLRIALIGLSGSGKSTCAAAVEEFAALRGWSCSRVKLAAPLYELQQQVYARTGVPLPPGGQDQVLMEALAEQLRRIDPRSLVDGFLRRLESSESRESQVVINDDLRDPVVDAPALVAAGFRVVRVRCDEELRLKRLAERGDLSRSDRSTRGLDAFRPDLVIENNGTRDELRAALADALGGLL